jgi:hypothetical protein
MAETNCLDLRVSQLLINFHEEPLSIIKLDASSREAGQDSENNFSAYTGCHKSERYFDKRSNE